ncbi:MAG: YbaB/EbfC family nucleoid-associated protein [Deltaproteobacteria bacterium]|nr:YbaB/EbfC family nucleoid-associated protein [Deltaproteobacteria bacterium]
MSKGFPGIPGNMQEMLKQAQKMQERLLKAQEEAANLTAEGSAGGGMVKAVANGKNQVTSLSIEREVVNPDDVDMLQDLVIAAVNEAFQKVQETVKSEMAKATGGMNIPGLF